MLLSRLIQVAQEQLAEHGDLECFDTAHFLIDHVELIETDPTEFPSDWDMPPKFFQIAGGQ